MISSAHAKQESSSLASAIGIGAASASMALTVAQYFTAAALSPSLRFAEVWIASLASARLVD